MPVVGAPLPLCHQSHYEATYAAGSGLKNACYGVLQEKTRKQDQQQQEVATSASKVAEEL